MRPETARRFDAQFAPRIARALGECLAASVFIEVLPHGGPAQPTRVHLHARALGEFGHYPLPLNVYLTWDGDEIERLMDERGEERFRHYLAALPRKLDAWTYAREIDFLSHTQRNSVELLGGLDFEA